jgi:hypothetical protein
MDALVAQLKAQEAAHWSHSEVETLIETQGRELLRRLCQAHFDTRSHAEMTVPVTDAQGQARHRLRSHTRDLETIFGTVTVTRTGYGAPGQDSLHPLDAGLNLPAERYSHTLRRRAAEGAAQNSFAETVQTLQAETGAKLPKRQAEELTWRAAQDFDAFYAARDPLTEEQLAASSGLLIVTCDGKGVPLRREDLRPATQKAAAARAPHLQHRRSKGEKPCTKRMSTVAAVYTIAEHRRSAEQVAGELRPAGLPAPAPPPRPENKRVWASLQDPPATVIGQALDEAARRDPAREKRWCALVDGNKTQIKELEQQAAERGVSLTIILDLIHVLEYLWRAAWVLHAGGDRRAEEWVTQRLLRLLRGESSQVAAGLKQSATKRQLSKQERAPLDKCAHYLQEYGMYLRYDEYLSAGLPLATGVIEGACRYLVKDRMEKTGARWRLSGAEAVLKLRALRASGDFAEYWSYHLDCEYEREHLARYAGEEVPEVLPCHVKERVNGYLRLVGGREATVF